MYETELVRINSSLMAALTSPTIGFYYITLTMGDEWLSHWPREALESVITSTLYPCKPVNTVVGYEEAALSFLVKITFFDLG